MSKHGIVRRQLSCGARFVGIPWQESAEAYHIGVSIPRGTAHDPHNGIVLKGAHHFLEHLLYKANSNSDRVRLATQIEMKGGMTNAWTNYLTTEAVCRVLPEQIGVGLNFILELAGRRPEFTSRELVLERQVVRTELGVYHDKPEEDVIDLAQENLYDPPFGGSALGGRGNIRGITGKNIMDLWESGYPPSGFTICVVGPEQDHLERIASQCDDILVRNRLLRNGYTPLNVQIKRRAQGSGERVRVIKGLDLCHIAIATECPHAGSPDFPSFDMLEFRLGDGFFTSTLYDELREKRGLVYNVDTNTFNGNGYGFNVVSLGVLPRNVSRAVEVLKRSFRIAADLSDADLRRFIDKKIGQMRQEPDSRSDILVEALEREAVELKIEDYLDRKEAYEKVTPDQVRARAAEVSPVLVGIGPKSIRNYID